MSDESDFRQRPGFLEIARRLNLLDEDAVQELALEAANRGEAPSQLVVEKGLLHATQIDLIETLRRPGEIVPGYEILDFVGQGGMGVVFRARQLNLDRIVALKTILISQMGARGMVARFEQEARTVARLRHPNIVAAHDFGRHEGRLYFAMEFIDGEDVQKRVEREGPLDEPTTWGLVRQAAAGLAHAARNDVVHRDIKPANLLLVAAPEGFPLRGLPMVKIADFGLAYLSSEAEQSTRLTAEGITLGSPHYMAPEQLQDKNVDRRADLYSLGATAFHMLSGQPPYAGAPLTKIVADKLGAEPPSLAEFGGVSKESAQLVAAMMARDPGQRPGDYRELTDLIDRLPLSHGGFDDIHSRFGDIPASLATRAKSDIASTAQFLRPDLKPSRPPLTKRVLIAGLICGVVAAISLIRGQLNRSPTTGERDLVPSGRATFLFDGRDLDVWTRSSTGGWNVTIDEESARVLAGSNGVVRRQLEGELAAGPATFDYYRLTVAVALHQAEIAEIAIGIPVANDQSGPELVVRIAADKANLLQIGGRRNRFVTIESRPLAGDLNQKHAVAIERHSNAWWVFLDDQQLGSVAARHQDYQPVFWLAVTDGTAWFSDISVEELVAP